MAPFAVLGILFVIFFTGCNTAKVTATKQIDNEPVASPSTVYVRDFELQAENIKESKGLLSFSGREGPVRRRLSGHAKNPEAMAKELVALMSESIVKQLTKDHIPALRLPPDAPTPTNGWLVRGVFTEVRQGNRLSRAVIGFGMGKTDAQAVAMIDNLADGPPKQFYQIETHANSKPMPGGAATVILSPFSIPLHFVMAGHDLKKNVKQTGTKIAGEISHRAMPGK